MIVIESGGTKSTWAYIDEENSSHKLVEAIGLHPREINAQKKNELTHFLSTNKNLNKNSHIFFYGAGCEKQKGKETITKLFKSHGFNKISVETDLKGACLAILGDQPGFIGILGTGAVAAQFDGQNIIKQTSGLGHLIGDEGSGFDIGKRLLNAFFNDDLPYYIDEKIEKSFLPETDIIHRIYQPDGRKVIANLTHIAKKYSSEKEIQSILYSAFSDYHDTALKSLPEISEIGFIGSVAYHFDNELQRTLLEHEIVVNKIYKSAIKPLFHYHLKHTE